ncbi:flagellar protein FliT [Halomonas mongoliensis]|uniref:Flagellar protein FliT n=1 Tax=Halomonas mongoliensis TaxID=321265 RepID=A0ABU1GP35_9GAMM|nr:flagellar protein FliT [Halomonas mongoliensis]MDR5893327.1 flagellar protein FliT [Halomonas mongoliensis]
MTPRSAAAGPGDREEMLLAAYATLRETSARMLTLARFGEWEALVEQESRYLVQVERIRRMDAQQSLRGERAARKAALLEQILEQDMEIRQCLVARRDELGRLIGNSRRQQSLDRAYGAQQGTLPIDASRRFGKRGT